MSSIFTLLNDKKVNKDLDNAKGMIMSMKQYYRFNYNINDYIDYYENNEWKVGKIINMNNATLSVVDIEKGSTYTLSHNQQNQLFFPFRSHTVRYTDSKNIIENDISNESLYEMNSFLSIILLENFSLLSENFDSPMTLLQLIKGRLYFIIKTLFMNKCDKVTIEAKEECIANFVSFANDYINWITNEHITELAFINDQFSMFIQFQYAMLSCFDEIADLISIGKIPISFNIKDKNRIRYSFYVEIRLLKILASQSDTPVKEGITLLNEFLSNHMIHNYYEEYMHSPPSLLSIIENYIHDLVVIENNRTSIPSYDATLIDNYEIETALSVVMGCFEKKTFNDTRNGITLLARFFDGFKFGSPTDRLKANVLIRHIITEDILNKYILLSDIHEELLKSSQFLINYIFFYSNDNKVCFSIIDTLYKNLTTNENIDLKKVYLTITEQSIKHMKIEVQTYIMNKLIENASEIDIDVVHSLAFIAKDARNDKAIEAMYAVVLSSKRAEIIDIALKDIVEVFKAEIFNKNVVLKYFNMCFTSIKTETVQTLKLMKCILRTYGNEEEVKEIMIKENKEHNLLTTLIDNLYQFLNEENDPNKTISKDNSLFDYASNIGTRLNLIFTINAIVNSENEESDVLSNTSLFKSMWSLFIKEDHPQLKVHLRQIDKNIFTLFIYNHFNDFFATSKKSSIIFNDVLINEKVNEPSSMIYNVINTFLKFFYLVNTNSGKGISHNGIFKNDFPSNLIGYNFIWKILSENSNEKIKKSTSTLLLCLLQNIIDCNEEKLQENIEEYKGRLISMLASNTAITKNNAIFFINNCYERINDRTYPDLDGKTNKTKIMLNMKGKNETEPFAIQVDMYCKVKSICNFILSKFNVDKEKRVKITLNGCLIDVGEYDKRVFDIVNNLKKDDTVDVEFEIYQDPYVKYVTERIMNDEEIKEILFSLLNETNDEDINYEDIMNLLLKSSPIERVNRILNDNGGLSQLLKMNERTNIYILSLDPKENEGNNKALYEMFISSNTSNSKLLNSLINVMTKRTFEKEKIEHLFRKNIDIIHSLISNENTNKDKVIIKLIEYVDILRVNYEKEKSEISINDINVEKIVDILKYEYLYQMGKDLRKITEMFTTFNIKEGKKALPTLLVNELLSEENLNKVEDFYKEKGFCINESNYYSFIASMISQCDINDEALNDTIEKVVQYIENHFTEEINENIIDCGLLELLYYISSSFNKVLTHFQSSSFVINTLYNKFLLNNVLPNPPMSFSPSSISYRKNLYKFLSYLSIGNDSLLTSLSSSIFSLISKAIKTSNVSFYLNNMPIYYNITLRNKLNDIGILNLGCTCYMNSLIQNLYHNKALFDSLITYSDTIDEASSVMSALKKILLMLRFSIKNSGTPKPLLESVVNYENRLMSPYEQMDVDEFFNLLLDRVEMFFDTNKNPFKKEYEGELETEIKSDQCGHKSIRNEPFNSLSLQVKGNKSLDDSLKEFFKTEILDGNNKYFCDECNAKVKAEKISSIKRLPRCLVITLKRFKYDYVWNRKMKINDYCSFDLEIDVKEYIKTECESIYDLGGIIFHKGDCDKGHYYTVIKTNGKWIEFNDTNVKTYDISNIKLDAFGADNETGNDRASAYVLFYYKRTHNDEYMSSINTITDVSSNIIKDIIEDNNDAFIKNIVIDEMFANFLSKIVLNYDSKRREYYRHTPYVTSHQDQNKYKPIRESNEIDMNDLNEIGFIDSQIEKNYDDEYDLNLFKLYAKMVFEVHLMIDRKEGMKYIHMIKAMINCNILNARELIRIFSNKDMISMYLINTFDNTRFTLYFVYESIIETAMWKLNKKTFNKSIDDENKSIMNNFIKIVLSFFTIEDTKHNLNAIAKIVYTYISMSSENMLYAIKELQLVSLILHYFKLNDNVIMNEEYTEYHSDTMIVPPFKKMKLPVDVDVSNCFYLMISFIEIAKYDLNCVHSMMLAVNVSMLSMIFPRCNSKMKELLWMLRMEDKIELYSSCIEVLLILMSKADDYDIIQFISIFDFILIDIYQCNIDINIVNTLNQYITDVILQNEHYFYFCINNIINLLYLLNIFKPMQSEIYSKNNQNINKLYEWIMHKTGSSVEYKEDKLNKRYVSNAKRAEKMKSNQNTMSIISQSLKAIIDNKGVMNDFSNEYETIYSNIIYNSIPENFKFSKQDIINVSSINYWYDYEYVKNYNCEVVDGIDSILFIKIKENVIISVSPDYLNISIVKLYYKK